MADRELAERWSVLLNGVTVSVQEVVSSNPGDTGQTVGFSFK